MFGKKKSEPKNEIMPENAQDNNQEKQDEAQVNNSTEELLNEISPEENRNYDDEDDKYSSVKSKISRILKSSNIEIIDENEGDEYEFENDKDKEKQQHDYDELKAIFGGNSKDKKQELTLSIDEFDYTYTGEYLDEFDLVHIKNIKKIKLQHKHSKLIKSIAIAASVLIVVGVAITLGIVLTRKTPVYLKSISLSKTEQTYYLNESFDYTGIYIYAEYSDGRVEKIKLNKDYFYDSTGYVERLGNDLVFVDRANSTEAVLYFRYSGLQTSIKIKILKKEITSLEAKSSDGLIDLTYGDYLTKQDLLLFAHYSNYPSEIIDFSDEVSITVGGGGTALKYVAEKKGYEITTPLRGKYLTITYEGKTLIVHIN